MNKIDKGSIANVHIKFPASLWKEFSIHAKINGTTNSKLIRNAVRKMLGKPESELEKIEEVEK